MAKILKTSFSQSLFAIALIHQTYGNALVCSIYWSTNLCSSEVIFSDQVICMYVSLICLCIYLLVALCKVHVNVVGNDNYWQLLVICNLIY